MQTGNSLPVDVGGSVVAGVVVLAVGTVVLAVEDTGSVVIAVGDTGSVVLAVGDTGSVVLAVGDTGSVVLSVGNTGTVVLAVGDTGSVVLAVGVTVVLSARSKYINFDLISSLKTIIPVIHVANMSQLGSMM